MPKFKTDPLFSLKLLLYHEFEMLRVLWLPRGWAYHRRNLYRKAEAAFNRTRSRMEVQRQVERWRSNDLTEKERRTV
jgi:hypothetical protein